MLLWVWGQAAVSGRGVMTTLPSRIVLHPDVLACERLKLGGEVAGAATLVDPGFVVSRPEVAESGVGVGEQMVDDGQYPLPVATIAFCLPRRRARRR